MEISIMARGHVQINPSFTRTPEAVDAAHQLTRAGLSLAGHTTILLGGALHYENARPRNWLLRYLNA